MSSRQFSFRAWSEALQNFYYFSFPDRGPETTYKELPNRIVQQFTGLFDRNSVPIYEGDIVRLITPVKKLDGVDRIYFEDGAFQFRGESLNYLSSPEFFEIIGNVYENPR